MLRSMGVRRCFGIGLVLFLSLAVAAGAGTHSSAVPIFIVELPEGGPTPAVPYPSTIAVAGETGVIGDVNATLSLITDEFPDDLDVLLVGPAGQKVILMADAGTGLDAGTLTGVTITLDDEAPGFLPDESQITAGSYRPSVYGITPDCDGIEPEPEVWPSPAPDPPYALKLNAFDGTAPNGTWSLYVVDDCFLFTSGVIAGGWSLTITPPTAVKLAELRVEPGRRSVIVRWRTGAEADVLGFNVFRSSGTVTTKLNRALLPTRAGGAGGARYAFADARVRAGTSYTYRLQAVDRSGRRSWSGSVSIRTPH